MRHLQIFTLVAGLLVAPSVLLAQATPQRPVTPSLPQRPQPPSGPQQSSPGMPLHTPNARETRDQLNEIFNQLPPSVRDVLRIDPTLLYRQDYVGTYPALAVFLEQHPEIAHNPAFFIGEQQFSEPASSSPGMEIARGVRHSVEFFAVVLIVATITTGVILLVRTAVEHRRWQRALRTQTDLHTKLIDRFGSSDELLAYLQSPAGKLLTETPTLPPAAPRAIMAAPLSRIFWSLQAGIVIGALGAGLVFVSGTADNGEVANFLRGVGIVVLMIGLGFTASAAVSYFLSQRLGLVQPLTTRFSGEAPGS